MAVTDSSFNAQGDTITAFETIDDASRDFGVKVHSNHICGVYGESMENLPAVGDRENQVIPRTGVFGRGDNIGVEGRSDLAGVYGEATTPDTGGLVIDKQFGIGIVGYSPYNRAAVFQCSAHPGFPGDGDFLQTVDSPEHDANTSAHIRLVPRPRYEDPINKVLQHLPENGLAGDFFVVYGGGNGEAIIWFCIKSHDRAKKLPGQWGLIQPTFIRDGGQEAVF